MTREKERERERERESRLKKEENEKGEKVSTFSSSSSAALGKEKKKGEKNPENEKKKTNQKKSHPRRHVDADHRRPAPHPGQRVRLHVLAHPEPVHHQRGQARHRREARARRDHGVDLVRLGARLLEQVAHDVLEDGLRLAEDVVVGGLVGQVLHPDDVLVERRLCREFFFVERERVFV